MTKSALKLAVMLTIVTAPTIAMAQPVLQMRCAVDSLDAVTALQRIEWARRCGLLTNTGGPNSWFSSPSAFDQTFSPAKDYQEIDPNHAYSSSLNSYNVNYTYGFCRYQSTPIYTVSLETSGPTAGFYKWSASTQRARPLYPTFESSPTAGTGTPLLPLPTLPNDCKLYQRGANGSFVPWTGNFYVIAYCEPI